MAVYLDKLNCEIMINPKTLYTIRNKSTNEVIYQTPFVEHILEFELEPPELSKGSTLKIEGHPEYIIEDATHFPFEREQLYLQQFPYNYTTLIVVSCKN